MNPTMNYSKLVSHWLLPQSAPSAIRPVVEALRKKGIEVCRVGMENPKAPIHYVFVNQPFDVQAVLAELHDTAGLSDDRNGSGINSNEYVWIGFEAGVCTSA
jgi:ribose 5-phosphate isomerase RpiB